LGFDIERIIQEEEGKKIGERGQKKERKGANYIEWIFGYPCKKGLVQW
jgi:hypothetical protein